MRENQNAQRTRWCPHGLQSQKKVAGASFFYFAREMKGGGARLFKTVEALHNLRGRERKRCQGDKNKRENGHDQFPLGRP